MNRWIYTQVDEWMGELIDGWTDGWMDKQMD